MRTACRSPGFVYLMAPASDRQWKRTRHLVLLRLTRGYSEEKGWGHISCEARSCQWSLAFKPLSPSGCEEYLWQGYFFAANCSESGPRFWPRFWPGPAWPCLANAALQARWRDGCAWEPGGLQGEERPQGASGLRRGGAEPSSRENSASTSHFAFRLRGAAA